MANIKITELPEALQVQDSDYFVVDNGTETKKVQKQNLGITTDAYTKDETDALLGDKVDKVTGKGLSTNDFTNAEKTKLEELESYQVLTLQEINTIWEDN